MRACERFLGDLGATSHVSTQIEDAIDASVRAERLTLRPSDCGPGERVQSTYSAQVDEASGEDTCSYVWVPHAGSTDCHFEGPQPHRRNADGSFAWDDLAVDEGEGSLVVISHVPPQTPTLVSTAPFAEAFVASTTCLWSGE